MIFVIIVKEWLHFFCTSLRELIVTCIIVEYTEFNIHSHPAVKALDKAMNLSKSIGFIKMILIDDPTSGILKWVPFDIQYGMPLFDKKLNREVCNKIEKFGLFEENNLREYSKSCRDLSLRLLDYIGQMKQEELDEKDLEADIVPLPNQIVSFYQQISPVTSVLE